jgi:NAD(P)-dependent dehydrogenase (short-subunit alcohol dehydrogenase family)
MSILLGQGIEDKLVILTGAASGIGFETALMLDKVGAKIAAIDINKEGLDNLSSKLKNNDHKFIEQDLSKIDEVSSLVKSLSEPDNNLWALIHPAAYLKRQRTSDVTSEDWDAQMSVNLKASFFLARECGDIMKEQGKGGRIIFFTSGAWILGSAMGETSMGADVYAASKGGVVSIVRSFAKTYGRHNILVNAISPGQVNTPMQHDGLEPGVSEEMSKSCPLGRVGEPQEQASVAVFLASEHASFINNSVINVSGGILGY